MRCGVGNVLRMKTLRRIVRYIRGHPIQFCDIILWAASQFRRTTPLDDKKPWVTFRAFRWLDEFLKPTSVVFEWGSGGSTLFFSQRVRQLVSVEHDRGWFDRVAAMLNGTAATNCDYRLREPVSIVSGVPGQQGACIEPYRSSQTGYESMDFKGYVTVVDSFPDEYFDLVFIDGRARTSCIRHALRKVRRNGALMLDNSDRERYQSSFQLLTDWRRLDLFGPGPYAGAQFVCWGSTVWLNARGLCRYPVRAM
jgi:hypothetical protein